MTSVLKIKKQLLCFMFFAMSAFSMSGAGAESIEFLDIVASDGALIPAVVMRPDGPGPHPIMVAPSSWALNRLEYIGASTKFVDAGFLTIGFTSRGFWTSQEPIDVAGEASLQDFSDVVDWAIEHEHGDAERVGAFGISYGAGIPLLAAARDSRVDAIVSMSGWYDLEQSFYPNETINLQGALLLIALGEITGNPGELLQQLPAAVFSDQVTDELIQQFDERSPINVIDQINANGVAVQIQHSWSDGIFSPSQMVSMYERLEGPRKLILAPGDHATAEALGLLGLPNTQFDEALLWMRRYVAGESIDTGDEVLLVSNDNRTILRADSWQEAVGTPTELHLTKPRRIWFSPRNGALKNSSTSSWSTRIDGNRPTLADSGIVMLTGFFYQLGLPPLVHTSLIDRGGAAVWKGDFNWSRRDIVGSPTLEVTVTPSRADTSIYAYLYEERFGISKLITHKPYSIRGATPGVPVDISMQLEVTDWNLAVGSKLVLVIDSNDLRYQDTTRSGDIRISSDRGSAVLTVPFRH